VEQTKRDRKKAARRETLEYEEEAICVRIQVQKRKKNRVSECERVEMEQLYI
jgi:hypothetical protein